MITLKVNDGELLASLTRQAAACGIRNGAIVSLIGAVDVFTISTMSAGGKSGDIVTDYAAPAELTGTGEIIDGVVHIHAVMAGPGELIAAGHLHRASVRTWFVHAYVEAADGHQE